MKEMRLGSGEVVIDRPNSHLHDGLGEALDQALAHVAAQGRQFIEAEFDLGRVIGERTLVETTADDTIVYAQRPRRAGLTRFAKNREAEPCSSITVVLKKGDQGQLPGDYYVLLTAYVGRVTPPEPWNERSFAANPDPEGIRAKSNEFWLSHALVYGSEEIIPETETSVCPW